MLEQTPNLVVEGGRLFVRQQAALRAKRVGEVSIGLESAVGVSRLHERLHQAAPGGVSPRIEDGKPRKTLDRFLKEPLLVSGVAQRLQRLGAILQAGVSFLKEPCFQAALEKRTPVKLHRAEIVAARYRGVEFEEIDLRPIKIEENGRPVRRAKAVRLIPQGATEFGQDRSEICERDALVAIGPEGARDPFARNRAVAS